MLMVNSPAFSNIGFDRNGITGIWNTPVAYTSKEGNFSAGYNYYYPEKKLFLNFSPYNFLEISLVYSSLENQPYIAYGNADYVFKEQSYKDKGFNVKIGLKDEGKWPAIAIGLNDINGSGIFAGEYLVASKKIKNISISSGIGWGLYSGGINFENPFQRNNIPDARAGEFNFDNLLNSDSVGIFTNLDFKINDRLNLYAEHDSFKDIKNKLDDNDNLSAGLTYIFKNNFLIKFGGNESGSFFLQLAKKNNYSNFKKSYLSTKQLKYMGINDLRAALQKNNVGVKEIENNENNTRLVLRQNYYTSQEQLDSIVSDTVKNFSGSVDNYEMEVIYTTVGMEVQNKTIYLKNKKNDRQVLSDYSIEDRFPYYNISAGLRPRLQIASREGFFHGSIDAGVTGEVVLLENLIASLDVKYSIANNFNEFKYPPVDTYPSQVRSDIKDYLLEYDNGLKVGRLQLDYFHGDNTHFNMISIGYLEEMFSGIIYEYLFFPQRSKIGFGYEINKAFKRDYKMRFGHKSYSNNFNRYNIFYKNEYSKTIWNISFGEYLAGDEGYTLSIDRYFSNGVKFGVFASFTNVSKQNFGEGSFDKGLNFTIPINIFGKKNNLYRYSWRPLTKDPAQLLIRKNRLIELVENYR